MRMNLSEERFGGFLIDSIRHARATAEVDFGWQPSGIITGAWSWQLPDGRFVVHCSKLETLFSRPPETPVYLGHDWQRVLIPLELSEMIKSKRIVIVDDASSPKKSATTERNENQKPNPDSNPSGDG